MSIPRMRPSQLWLVLSLHFLLWAAFPCFRTAVAAIPSSVQIDRDDKGVWFITGPDTAPTYDIFAAMGYSVATDRLFQMEQFRRSSTGRMAEVFGGDFIESDTLARKLGYSDSELTTAFSNLNKLEPDEKDVIQGYVDGVNERINEVQSDPANLLPFEFVALDFEPEPWTVNQVLAWSALVQRRSDEAFETTQIENAALLDRLVSAYGEETAMDMFNDLRWTQDPAAITSIDWGVSSARRTRNLMRTDKQKKNVRHGARSMKLNGNLLSGMQTLAADVKNTFENAIDTLDRAKAIIKLGSYGWVVSGNLTESGNPTHYAGSQPGWGAPAFICEGSIRAGDLDVSGIVVPGIPMIIDVVRTPYNVWSFEDGMAHTTDYYLEDASDVSLHRMETIKVAGKDDVELPVYRGQRGPVVAEFGNETVVTWKYSQWNYELQSVGALLKMLRARSIDEFQAGVRGLGFSVHTLYADRDGNIAYWMSGRTPVREPGEWRLPQGLVADAIDWDAAVIQPLPADINSPRFWYGNWNNKPSVDYPSGMNSVNAIQGPFHGVHAIYDNLDQKLGSEDKLTFDQIRKLALDIGVTLSAFGAGGTSWFFAKEYFEGAVDRVERTDPRANALELLDAWDGKFVAGGEAAWISGTERAEGWVLSTNWISEVLKMVFFDELATPTGDGSFELIEIERILFNVLLHGLEYPESLSNRYNWFTNLANTTAPQDADTIIVEALDKVLAEWDSFDFSRGDIVYEHPLLLEVWRAPLWNRGTYDHIVEMGPDGPVRIESTFPLGESGFIGVSSETGETTFDPNFFSMTPLFDNFTLREFPLFGVTPPNLPTSPPTSMPKSDTSDDLLGTKISRVTYFAFCVPTLYALLLW